MPIGEEEMIVSTADYLVTENTLNPRASAAEIATFVRTCKTTGQITYAIHQGGTRSVVVVERTKITEEESNDVRKAMGMDYEVEVEGEEPKSAV